jgi:hypothetical protein
MTIWNIDGSEISYFSLSVEADTQDEAIEKAKALWADGHFTMNGSELGGLEVWKKAERA